MRALSHKELNTVRWKVESLSPYPEHLRIRGTAWGPDGNPIRVSEPRLLRSEPENQPPPGTLGLPRIGPLASVVSAKRYDLAWITQPGDHVEIHDGQPVIVPPTAAQLREHSKIVVVNASAHGAPHHSPPGIDDWVAEAAAPLIARNAEIDASEPEWLDDPAYIIYTATRPSLLALHPDARPYSKIALWNARLGGGRHVAAWHPGFDPYTAEWRNADTQQPSSPLQRDGYAAGPCGFIGDTYRNLIQRLRTSTDPTAMTTLGAICWPNTRGLIEPSPTTAIGTTLIGKESRRFRDGRELDPDQLIYTHVDDWPQLIETLRRLTNQLPLADVAARVGISERTLRRILAGSDPSTRTRRKIAESVARELGQPDLDNPGWGRSDHARAARYLDQAGPEEHRCKACERLLPPGSRRQKLYCGGPCRMKAHRSGETSQRSEGSKKADGGQGVGPAVGEQPGTQLGLLDRVSGDPVE